jgi:NTE family protein
MRQRLLVNISVNKISLFSLKNLIRFIDAVIPKVRIQDLPRPFAALSNDILTGREVILDRGDLRTAVLAATNIPGFFPPVPLEGMLLVDAGITQMVPVKAAGEHFGGPVWAVDVSQELEPMTGRENLVDLTYRYAAITQHCLRLLQLEEADRVLRPDVEGVEWFDFSRLDELVEAGRRAVPERIRT